MYALLEKWKTQINWTHLLTHFKHISSFQFSSESHSTLPPEKGMYVAEIPNAWVLRVRPAIPATSRLGQRIISSKAAWATE